MTTVTKTKLKERSESTALSWAELDAHFPNTDVLDDPDETPPKPTVKKTKKTKTPTYTTLRKLEIQILEKVGICVVFRASPETLIPGEGYNYVRAMKKDATLKHFVTRLDRILSKWKGGPVEYAIVLGNGRLVRTGWENQSLAKIQDSYKVADK